MKTLLTLLLLCFFIKMNAQAPFAMKATFRNATKADIKKKVAKTRDLRFNFVKTNRVDSIKAYANAIDDQYQNVTDHYNDELLAKEKSPDVFNQFGAGLVIGDDVNTLFPTINGEIITYRLGAWSNLRMRNSSGKKTVKVTKHLMDSLNKIQDFSSLDTVRHYLPLSIISKVSGNNQNNTGTVNDATSFFGAPLTFRLTPILYSHDFLENKIVVGMYHDLRIVAIGDTNTNKIDAGIGYYGAFGITYFGEGNASNSNEPETVVNGKWSFSSLVYLFKSGGKFNKAVFGDYNNKSLSGLELLLRFKPNNAKDSKFNLMLGANYGFTQGAPNYAKWEFKLGVGN